MREALEASRALKVPVMVHCEDPGLTGGSMHEGATSRRLGLRDISGAAEEIIITRDLALAAITGGWLHICHVSTGIGVDLIAASLDDDRRVGCGMPAVRQRRRASGPASYGSGTGCKG
jgi:dihydroorotase